MTPNQQPCGPRQETVPWTPNLNGHLPVLDGIRGLAILLVMVFHFKIMEDKTSCDALVTRLMSAGWIGVDLFFVLSGFLITGILYEAKESKNYFVNFYARRTVRIFPLYYAVVFATLVVLPHIPYDKLARFGRVTGDETWYWLYLSNFVIAYRQAFRHGILDVSWSLAIEEQFYLLWPAMVLFCRRRTLMTICLLMMAVALLFRCALVATGAHPFAIYVLTPARMDALAMGAWIALAARGPGGVARLLPYARWVAPAAGLAVLGIMLCDGTEWEGKFVHTVGFTGLALFFGSLLILGVGSPPQRLLSKTFSRPLLMLFGRYSYALYLFHLPMRALIHDTCFSIHWCPAVFGSQLPEQLCFDVLVIAATLLLALLSWHLYEKHFLKLKKYFPTDQATLPAEAEPALGGLKLSENG